MDIARKIVIAIALLTLLLSPVAAEEADQPLLTALSNTTISGYVDVGAHWNPGSGNAVPLVTRGTEILWQHEDGRVAIWLMAGTELIESKPVQIPPPRWPGPRTAVAFDNGSIFFRQSNYLWKDQTFINVAPALSLKNYAFAGAAQLVGDAYPNLIWNHGAHLLVWEMNGSRVTRQYIIDAPFFFPAGARIVGIDRFDVDNSLDLLWQDPRGFVWVTLMDGPRYKGIVPLNNGRPANHKWTLSGTGDFNFDGKPDLLWQHEDGRTATWFMNGTTRVSAAPLRGGKRVKPGWRIVDSKRVFLATNQSTLFTP